MTPSEAHDSAWKREPSHDQMTIDVCYYLCERLSSITRGGKSVCLVEFEMEFLHKPQRGRWFFSDILLTYEYQGGRHFYWSFEIKPKIFSAGAIIRQEKMLRSSLYNWAAPENDCDAVTIVRGDDPLLGLLVHLKQDAVFWWDGESLGSSRSNNPIKLAGRPMTVLEAG